MAMAGVTPSTMNCRKSSRTEIHPAREYALCWSM